MLVALAFAAGCQSLFTPQAKNSVVPASITEKSLKKSSPDAKDAMYPTTLELDTSLFRSFAPSNNRDWTPEQAVLATVDFNGEMATVRNIRDCHWRREDDFTIARYDRTYDLRKLKTVDFIVVPFNAAPSMGHTMLSFGFEDGDYLAISVEIRKERSEQFSAVAGFFRQYELIYIVASERDVIQKRVNCDLSDVYLYRSTATPEQAQSLFMDVMQRVNQLAVKPEFYDTLTNNCTTNIRRHINHLKSGLVPYDYRVLLPGYSDELAYDLNLIEHDGSYAQTRQRARINEAAFIHRNSPDFSAAIRR